MANIAEGIAIECWLRALPKVASRSRACGPVVTGAATAATWALLAGGGAIAAPEWRGGTGAESYEGGDSSATAEGAGSQPGDSMMSSGESRGSASLTSLGLCPSPRGAGASASMKWSRLEAETTEEVRYAAPS